MLTANSLQYTHEPLIKPRELINQLPAPQEVTTFVQKSRISAGNIIAGMDKRLLVIIGPCSIHDVDAAIEYGEKLKKAAELYSDDLFIIMRSYFQKPRTTLGWKGLIHDPYLDNSYNANQGLWLARSLSLELNNMRLPVATEFVDPMIHHYLSDLITWTAIGARSVESQVHRELASALTMPVGFKNNTDGNIQVAIDAVKVAKQSHYCLSMNSEGTPSVITTNGNDQCHIVLRGSNHTTNYSSTSVNEAANCMRKMNLTPRIMIDCSHGNSVKNPYKQKTVIDDIAIQIKNGSNHICGVMLESHLFAGKQAINPKNKLTYGQSITDECLGWKDSLSLLEQLAVINKHAPAIT